MSSGMKLTKGVWCKRNCFAEGFWIRPELSEDVYDFIVQVIDNFNRNRRLGKRDRC